MTSMRRRTRAEAGPTGFEVATISSDTLRAGIRVTGSLSEATCPLLTSIIHTHVRAGRRYLRVDLAAAFRAAGGSDDAVLEPLRGAHEEVAALGGLLVFENAAGALGDALRGGDLFVPAAR